MSSTTQILALELLIPRSDGQEPQESLLPSYTLVKSPDGTYLPCGQPEAASSHSEAAHLGLSHLKISSDSRVIPLDARVEESSTHWNVTISYVRLPISSYVEGSAALH